MPSALVTSVGFRPSCHVDNAASRGVAEKCGFDDVCRDGDELHFRRPVVFEVWLSEGWADVAESTDERRQGAERSALRQDQLEARAALLRVVDQIAAVGARVGA
jgi:hypothetical protein